VGDRKLPFSDVDELERAIRHAQGGPA